MEDPSIDSSRLIEELCQPVFVADVDTYEILYMNRACRQRLQCEDYSGAMCYEVVQGLDAPCPFCTNAMLVKGEVYRWEHHNKKLDCMFQLQDNLIDYQGRHARIEVAFDVSDHVSRERDLSTVLETQRELAKAIQIINGPGAIGERLNGALENGGEHFQADRSYIFLINKQGSLDNVYEWCRDGVVPQIENLQGVDPSLIDRWMPYFKENKAVVTPDVEEIRDGRPEEYRILKEQDINSLAEAPLYDGDRIVGFVGLDNPSPEKIENVGELLIPLAYSISNAIARAAEEHEQREMFSHTIQSLFSANPESLCTFRVNLTRNVCQEAHGISQYILDSLQSDTVDGILGNAAKIIPTPREREEFLKDFSRERLLELYRDGKIDHSVDYRRRGEDGRPIWVRTFAKMLRNPESGDVEGIIYSLNITKDVCRDRAFSIIADQEYDYEALLDPENDTIRFLNLSSRLLPKYHERLGKPDAVYPHAVVSQFAADAFVASEDRELFLGSCRPDVIRENLERDGRYEFQVRGHYTGKPDELMYRRLQYYYLDDTRDTILVVQSDVTSAVLRQKKETEYVEDILDSVSTGIVSFRMPDADHLEGIFVNLQMFRILGMGEPDSPDARQTLMSDPLIADYMKDAFVAVYPDDLERVRKAFRDGYYKDYFSAGNYRIMRQDGSPVWVNQDATLREIRPDGRIFYASYRAAEREVELQAKLEEQLESEKLLREEADAANSAKTDFLSRMSHDIRTPLNGIIGMTYLTREMDLPDKARENLEKIDTSSKFLLGLINNILDMSRVESSRTELKPEPYPIDEFNGYLDAVIRPLCQERGQRFVLDEQSAVLDVVPLADKLQCNQIFFNLLSNAVKYTPEGGTITYKIRCKPLESGKMQIEHEITDTGIGMSDRFQKVLFEPFTQENREDASERRGSGLGLAIVKKLVDRMDGTIAVRSSLGKGTTFRVTLQFDTVPASVLASASEKGTQADGQTASLAGRHILLCEDHPLNQEIVRALLSERQAIVSVATDGKAGVDMFHDSYPGFYDALLMDIRMPVMDGYEATRRIRAMDRDDAKTVPIIAMTADAFADDIQKCLREGMNGHVAKPVDPELLYQELSEAVAHR